MRKTKYFRPYQKSGKTNLAKFQGKSGVYIIKAPGSEKLLYVGHSKTDIYKTVTRHFQSWNDRSQIRVTYSQKSDLLIRIVLTTPNQAPILERALIVKHKPKDNPYKFELFSPSKEEVRQDAETLKILATAKEIVPF